MTSFLIRLLLCVSCACAAEWSAAQGFDVAHGTGKGDWLLIETHTEEQAPTEHGPLLPPSGRSGWVQGWEKRRLGIRTLGFAYNGIWARTRLDNDSDTPRWGWIEVTEPFTDYVDCFVEGDTGEQMVYRLGDHRRYDARPIKYPGILIPVNVFPRGSTLVSCLIRNNGSTASLFRYWDPEQYAMAERQWAFSRALCYGALAFTIVVSIVLAIINGNPLSFLLVAELLPVLGATTSREGDAFQLLWPTHPEFNLPPYQWILIGIITASMVFRRIIETVGWEERVINTVLLSSALILVSVFLLPAQAPGMSLGVQAMAIVYPLVLLWICGRHWHENAIAKLLALGMFVQLVALAINAAGVFGLLEGAFGVASLYASVVKALTLAGALFYRMKIDRWERDRAQAQHTTELERRLAFEAQLRHAASHHPRYGMPNQAMLEACLARQGGEVQRVSVWIVKLNRFGFLESVLPPDTLATLVKVYADELVHWFDQREQERLLPIDSEHRLAALDDSTLSFVMSGPLSDHMMSELEAFLTRRFEWQGMFVAWDPHIGVAIHEAAPVQAPAGAGGNAIDAAEAARMALQWCSAHRRIVPFDAERMKRDQLAYGLTLDLEGAIDRGELLLHYQPKVTLQSRRTESLEALVRWRHPERGMIPPGAFIAEAEATGAINRLTMWAIGEAARFLLTLPDPAVRVSVNITAFDLATPRFVNKVLETLRQEGCPPSRLILEVTESAALSDRDRASQILSRLRDEGVRIALDDFGTGYSSLGILQEMPLDEMKVDRSFVTDIAGFGRKQAVLQAMIEVGHRLGLTVTIEGVEHADSVAWLSSHGCDVVQGFYFSRPLDADAARCWLATPLPATLAGGVTPGSPSPVPVPSAAAVQPKAAAEPPLAWASPASEA